MGARRYEVRIKAKVARGLAKLPRNVQKTVKLLVLDLEESGPLQRAWNNFGALGPDEYHCHMTHRYVACWSWQKGSDVIEVYYAGSREDAPY